MPYHTGTKSMNPKPVKKNNTKKDVDPYIEHAKHHSAKHIKAMKELEKKFGATFKQAHSFVKKYVD